MFRYRLHSPDGDDLGEATYAMMIKAGEEILVGNGRRFRVLDVVPFEEEDEPTPLLRHLDRGTALGAMSADLARNGSALSAHRRSRSIVVERRGARRCLGSQCSTN
jgi:hypothetical protein